MNPVALGGSLTAAILDRPSDLATHLFRGGPDTGAEAGTGRHGAARDLISLSQSARGLLSDQPGAGAADLVLGETAVGQVAREALRAISDDLTALVAELGFDEVAKGFVHAFIKPAFDALRDGDDFNGRFSVLSAERATVVTSGAVATAQSLFANTVEIDISSAEGSVSIRINTIRFESVSTQMVGNDFVSAAELADALRDIMQPMLDMDDVLEAAEAPSSGTVEAAVLKAYDPDPSDDEDPSAVAATPAAAAAPGDDDGIETTEAAQAGALPQAEQTATSDGPAQDPAQEGHGFETRYRLTAAYRFQAEGGTDITRIRLDAIVDLRAASTDQRATIGALLHGELRPSDLAVERARDNNDRQVMEPFDA